MDIIGPILSLLVIAIVAWQLLKHYYPHAVLLVAGVGMLVLSKLLGLSFPVPTKSSGAFVFDLFVILKDSFSHTLSGVGLMIMAIGGFVAYADKIGASAMLVHVAMRPLRVFHKYPHLTAVFVLPLGQLLFICIPSAAGLGLLLMASVFPLLVQLGVSRLSAVSIITGCTVFGVGPASAISASASTIAGEPAMTYFITAQLPLMLPITLVMMVAYYIINRRADKKLTAESATIPPQPDTSQIPKIYALIPLIPLLLLVVFSDLFQLFPKPIVLNTTTAMFISLAVAMCFEWVRYRSLRKVLESLRIFWQGMGNIFKSVVTLVVAADLFAQGLIALDFIDGLVRATTHLGLGALAITVVMAIMIFLASMLMGSGNASFFAFGPLVPNIAAQFGVKTTSIILPMNLAASMGRAVSPVSGVLIATAEIAGVETMAIAKRNFVPLILGLAVLLIFHFV